MLDVSQIDASYGDVQVLRGMSLTARPGEIVCLLGRNGAGKTTTLKAIMGLVRPRNGTVTLDGERIDALPAHSIAAKGVGYVPQGRRLFADLTVAENLRVGLMAGTGDATTRERALALFPRLRERLDQRAGTLSGGEQQMLATARALCVEPKVLLLDEPTEGLQPSMISAIRDVVIGLREAGTAIVLVEQRVDAVIAVADRVVFIENGERRDEVAAETLRDDLDLVHRYVGVG